MRGIPCRAVLRLATRWAEPFATSRAYVRDHPITAAFAARFPRTHEFLADRFRTTQFTGLPLTLIATAALYLAALFGGLIDELFEAEGLVQADRSRRPP